MPETEPVKASKAKQGVNAKLKAELEELKAEFASFKAETASNFHQMSEAIKLTAEYVGKYRGELQVHLDTPDAHHPAIVGGKK